MTCFNPVAGYQNPSTGQFTYQSFCKRSRVDFRPLTISCGHCVGCLISRSGGWAARCVHESQLSSSNSFITVTFNPSTCPLDNSLSVRTHQLFVKSLREAVARHYGSVFRFYMCGEYGTQYGRPHYHYLIFGFGFPDRYKWSVKRGVTLYRSPFLESVWKDGFSSVGDLNHKTCSYVARYIHQKKFGDLADDHYFDPSTGVFRLPEFNLMSRRPGIARAWFDQFRGDVFPHDRVILEAKAYPVPRYYNRLFEAQFPAEYDEVRQKRILSAVSRSIDNTPERLHTREVVAQANLARLKREMEVFRDH